MMAFAFIVLKCIWDQCNVMVHNSQQINIERLLWKIEQDVCEKEARIWRVKQNQVDEAVSLPNRLSVMVFNW